MQLAASSSAGQDSDPVGSPDRRTGRLHHNCHYDVSAFCPLLGPIVDYRITGNSNLIIAIGRVIRLQGRTGPPRPAPTRPPSIFRPMTTSALVTSGDAGVGQQAPPTAGPTRPRRRPATRCAQTAPASAATRTASTSPAGTRAATTRRTGRGCIPRSAAPSLPVRLRLLRTNGSGSGPKPLAC